MQYTLPFCAQPCVPTVLNFLCFFVFIRWGLFNWIIGMMCWCPKVKECKFLDEEKADSSNKTGKWLLYNPNSEVYSSCIIHCPHSFPLQVTTTLTALCPLHPEYRTPYMRWLRQILGMSHPDELNAVSET